MTPPITTRGTYCLQPSVAAKTKLLSSTVKDFSDVVDGDVLESIFVKPGNICVGN